MHSPNICGVIVAYSRPVYGKKLYDVHMCITYNQSVQTVSVQWLHYIATKEYLCVFEANRSNECECFVIIVFNFNGCEYGIIMFQ